jgi:hypothetical protein
MKKLVAAMFAVDTLVVALVAWLLRQPFIPDRRSLILAYLFPIAFSFHVLEEFVLPGKGEDWFRLYRPRFAHRYTEAYFVKVNAIGFAGAALVPLGLFDYRGGYSLGGICGNMIFASALLANACYHVRGSIETKQYSPGTITGLVLYVPLAMAFYVQMLRMNATNGIVAVICLAVGSQIQRVIDSTHERALTKRNS